MKPRTVTLTPGELVQPPGVSASPPMAMTAPHLLDAAMAMAASAVAVVGSPPGQWYTTDAMPSAVSAATRGLENRSDAPVTTSS